MMYLVTPTQLLWTSLSHIKLEELVEMGANLEAIQDWTPAERPLTHTDVRVALRYGIPVQRGIVVDAIWIIDQQRAKELREANARAKKARQHPTIRKADKMMEEGSPGWIAQGEELDRRIDEQSERSAREAEEKARRQLEVPLKPELVDHWESLGGAVPE